MKRLMTLLLASTAAFSSQTHAFDIGELCEDGVVGEAPMRRCVDSRKFEFGYLRDQRFDRKDAGSKAFGNRAYISYRTDAKSLEKFADSDCGTPLEEKCGPKLTYEFDGLLSLGLDDTDQSSLFGKVSLYWPLMYQNDQGIYDPSDAHRFAIGVSGQIGGIANAFLDPDLDLGDQRFGVFFKYRCLYGMPFKDQGNTVLLGGRRCSKNIDTGTGISLDGGVSMVESGGKRYDRTVNYLRAELLFGRTAKTEWGLRARYADTYDNKIMDNEYSSVELGINWQIKDDVDANGDGQLRFDLGLGYQTVRGNQIDQDDLYIRPSIYFRFSPGQRGPEGPVSIWNPGGPGVSWW